MSPRPAQTPRNLRPAPQKKEDGLVKGAFGPYVGWIALVAIYLWPFFTFHGPARFGVGIPWLICAIIVTAAGASGKNTKNRNRP